MVQWHWISAAGCLVGMLLFAATGITLNNASHIEAAPRVRTLEARLPEGLRAQLSATPHADRQVLPTALRYWLASQWSLHAGQSEAEWSGGEIYLSLPRPGGDAWLSIDLESGKARYEITERGWIAYFNDLHKGRSTGTAWSWFIDLFAVACLLFCATGLVLLHLHSANRRSTWPLVGLGLAIPLLLALLFIH